MAGVSDRVAGAVEAGAARDGIADRRVGDSETGGRTDEFAPGAARPAGALGVGADRVAAGWPLGPTRAGSLDAGRMDCARSPTSPARIAGRAEGPFDVGAGAARDGACGGAIDACPIRVEGAAETGGGRTDGPEVGAAREGAPSTAAPIDGRAAPSTGPRSRSIGAAVGGVGALRDVEGMPGVGAPGDGRTEGRTEGLADPAGPGRDCVDAGETEPPVIGAVVGGSEIDGAAEWGGASAVEGGFDGGGRTERPTVGPGRDSVTGTLAGGGRIDRSSATCRVIGRLEAGAGSRVVGGMLDAGAGRIDRSCESLADRDDGA